MFNFRIFGIKFTCKGEIEYSYSALYILLYDNNYVHRVKNFLTHNFTALILLLTDIARRVYEEWI